MERGDHSNYFSPHTLDARRERWAQTVGLCSVSPPGSLFLHFNPLTFILFLPLIVPVSAVFLYALPPIPRAICFS